MTFRKTTVLTLLILLPMLAELAVSPPLRAQAAPLAALPATDAFGYTAATITQTPLSICSSGGVEISFENIPLEGFSGPLPIGFWFPFYEKTYNTFRVSINGLITFSDSTLEAYDHLPMPVDLLPNDLVAPFWTDLELSAGKVCYKYTAADPYMAVEWNNVELNGITGVFTFQALLYSNGDIQFQYPTAIPKVDYATVGIEDSEGIFGLLAFYNEGGLPVNPGAIRITHPAKWPDGRFAPTFASNFLIKRVANVNLTLQNISGAPKTFDLANGGIANRCDWKAGGWEVTFSQGSTHLGDTNSNGCPDVQIQEFGQVNLTARILAPQNVQVGAFKDFTLTAVPEGQSPAIVDMTLRAAVPASFAQAYVGNNVNMYLAMISPTNRSDQNFAGDFFYGKNLSVTQTGTKGYLYGWERAESSSETYYLKGTIFTKTGGFIKREFDLTSRGINSDQDLAVGSTPNGNLATVWIRNANELLLSIFSPDGTILYKEIKIANGNSPSAPRIATDINNNFYIVWVESNAASQTDVFLSILNSKGGTIVNRARVTNRGSTTEDYIQPAVTELKSGGAIIAYSVKLAAGTQAIAYSVTNPAGGLMTEKRFAYSSLRTRGKDLIQLSGGKVLLSWIDENTHHVHYTLLSKDAAGNYVNGPIGEFEPPYQFSANNVSVTRDEMDHGIITWAEELLNRTLSYALIDSAGSVLTPPMIFMTGWLETNAAGQGNAPYDGRQLLFIPLVTR